MQPHSHRRQVPLWQIAPFCLVPPVLVAALTYYVELNSQVVVYTFALSCAALLLIAAPHKQVRWALVAAVVVLGIVLALGGVTVDGLAAAFVKLAHGGRGLGA